MSIANDSKQLNQLPNFLIPPKYAKEMLNENLSIENPKRCIKMGSKMLTTAVDYTAMLTSASALSSPPIGSENEPEIITTNSVNHRNEASLDFNFFDAAKKYAQRRNAILNDGIIIEEERFSPIRLLKLSDDFSSDLALKIQKLYGAQKTLLTTSQLRQLGEEIFEYLLTTNLSGKISASITLENDQHQDKYKVIRIRFYGGKSIDTRWAISEDVVIDLTRASASINNKKRIDLNNPSWFSQNGFIIPGDVYDQMKKFVGENGVQQLDTVEFYQQSDENNHHLDANEKFYSKILTSAEDKLRMILRRVFPDQKKRLRASAKIFSARRHLAKSNWTDAVGLVVGKSKTKWNKILVVVERERAGDPWIFVKGIKLKKKKYKCFLSKPDFLSKKTHRNNKNVFHRRFII